MVFLPGFVALTEMRWEKMVNDAFSLGQTGFEMSIGLPKHTDRKLEAWGCCSEHVGAGVTNVKLPAQGCQVKP